jgi:hypothetical protein
MPRAVVGHPGEQPSQYRHALQTYKKQTLNYFSKVGICSYINVANKNTLKLKTKFLLISHESTTI